MSTSTTMRGGMIPHAMQSTSWRPVRAAGPDMGLNACLPGFPINIISNSATRKIHPRHSSIPYDELKPRLRP
jgi:hypothetical protein